MSQRVTQAELAAEVIDGLDEATPGAVERATAEFPARSVAAAAAARAGGDSPGGSQPGMTLIKDFLFTEPQTPAEYPITAADDVAGTFTIAGDHTAKFPPGHQFNVYESSNNDNEYNVLSSEFTGGNTVITVNPIQGMPSDDTADGEILGGLVAVFEVPEGATVYDVELFPVAPWTTAQENGQTQLCVTDADGNCRQFYSGMALADFTDPYDPLDVAVTNYSSLTWQPGAPGTFKLATPYQDPASTRKPGGGVPYPDGGSITMSVLYIDTGAGEAPGQIKIRIKYATAPTVVNAA